MKVDPGLTSHNSLDSYTVLARSNKQIPVNRLIVFLNYNLINFFISCFWGNLMLIYVAWLLSLNHKFKYN